MKESAEPSSLASEAYTVVRQRILRGDIGLGQVISRRKLAAELSMSFLPVSEALLRLEIRGAAREPSARRHTRAHPVTRRRQGHYVVREALEVQAAMRFTQVGTAGERAELKKLAARVDQLSQQMDRPLYQTVHQKLHARIAQCARCPALLDAIEKTHALASIWFCVMRTPKPEDSPTRHQSSPKPCAVATPTALPTKCVVTWLSRLTARWKCCSHTSGCARRPAARSTAATSGSGRARSTCRSFINSLQARGKTRA